MCHPNAKGNKCRAGHRHNGTAITLAVIVSLAKHSRPKLRSHVAFWPIASFCWTAEFGRSWRYSEHQLAGETGCIGRE